MSNRRQFLEQSLIGCGIVGLTSRTRAFFIWLFAAKPHLLPDEGWEFFEIDGKVLFPIYAVNGGISTRMACWLLQQSGKQWYAIPVEYTHADMDVMGDPCPQWTAKITDAIKNTKPVPVNLDGGVLPLPREVQS